MVDIRIDMKELERLDKFQESRLLMRWAPRLYFHPHNSWYPIDLDVYVENCHGLTREGERIAEAGTLTWDEIARREGTDEAIEALDIDDDWLNANRGVKKNLRAYGIAGRMSEGHIVLCYPIFYAENPNVPVALIFGAGYHKADLEFVYFILDSTGEELHWAYMTAHGSMEHSLVPARDLMCNGLEVLNVPFLSTPDRLQLAPGQAAPEGDCRPSVFVALNSHAMFWRPGTHWRIFGVTADICSADGPMLDLAEEDMLHVMNLDKDPIFKYTGRMGDTGVASFAGRRLSISLMHTYPASTASGRQFFFGFVHPPVGFFTLGVLASIMVAAAALFSYVKFIKSDQCKNGSV